MKKTLITLTLIFTSFIAQALEGNFWVKEVGKNSVIIAPLVYNAPVDMRGMTSSMTSRGGGGGPTNNQPRLIKKQEPVTYIPWDKTNINFKAGTMFHAEYTSVKKYGYEYFTVSKYTIIQPIKNESK